MGNMVTMQISFSVFFIRVGENRPSWCEDKMRSNERSALKTVKGSTSQERRVKTRFSLPRTQSAVLDRGRSWLSVTAGIHQQITITSRDQSICLLDSSLHLSLKL